MKKLVSVICTVKNGETTISETIESVLKQTYKNIEFIIIDDGSTDNTKNILEGYKSADHRVKPYYSGGIGRAPALNKAINLSKGDFIANIDADDLMHPRKIELQVEAFREKTDFFLIATASLLIYDDNKPEWDKNVNSKVIESVKQNVLIRNTISHPSVMINKDLLVALGRYNETRKNMVDYELWLRAFSNNYKMGILKEKLTAKRIHSNQSFENKKRLNYTWSAMKLQLSYIIKNIRYFYYLPFPILSFLLAQLPFKARRKINRVVKKIVSNEKAGSIS